jgi:hypothetical protein
MKGYMTTTGKATVKSTKRVSKTWEASQRLRGSIVVLDKSILD